MKENRRLQLLKKLNCMRTKIETQCWLLITFTFLFSQATAQNIPQPVNQNEFFDSLNKASIGKEFPRFSAQGPHDFRISSSDLKDKVVFINFWFSNCSPCIREINGLNRLYDSISNNSNVLFLSFTYDPFEESQEAVKKFGIRFPVLNVSREECYRLNLHSGFPTNFILNRSGIIKWTSYGAPPDQNMASHQIFEAGLSQIQKEL